MVAFLVTGRATTRFGAGTVMAAGSAVFAAGVAWWAAGIGLRPNYLGAVLGGMLLTGVGTGLTLPTYMASATSSLPPQAFATGSAVIAMLRQIGIAVGVAILVAVLGSPSLPAERLAAYHRGWTVVALLAVVGAVVGSLGLSSNVQSRGADPEVVAVGE